MLLKPAIAIILSALFTLPHGIAQPAATTEFDTVHTTANRTYSSYMHQPAVATQDTSVVIGFAINTLYKKQPESPLGNFMADCMKLSAEKNYKRQVDAAFVNPGSIRSFIPKGNITVGSIYRLMPYDNAVVLVKLKGEILADFLNHIASLGGWPCAGLAFTIKDKTAVMPMIGGSPLDENKTYIIAVSDYVAKGGNQCTMLKGLPQANNHYLFRDALIDYVKSFTSGGNPADAKIEGRILQ